MKTIYLFLADGFEDIEALATTDILRRAGLSVCTVSLNDNKISTSAHGVSVQADAAMAEVASRGAEAQMLVLPGGMPGATNLSADSRLRKMIEEADAAGVPLSAICAAPLVYGRMGLLRGVKAVCYPGFEGELAGAEVQHSPVVVDGRFTTAWGPGATFAFAFALVERLCGAEKVKELQQGMLIAH